METRSPPQACGGRAPGRAPSCAGSPALWPLPALLPRGGFPARAQLRLRPSACAERGGWPPRRWLAAAEDQPQAGTDAPRWGSPSL